MGRVKNGPDSCVVLCVVSPLRVTSKDFCPRRAAQIGARNSHPCPTRIRKNQIKYKKQTYRPCRFGDSIVSVRIARGDCPIDVVIGAASQEVQGFENSMHFRIA